jgi:hypothetical protein
MIWLLRIVAALNSTHIHGTHVRWGAVHSVKSGKYAANLARTRTPACRAPPASDQEPQGAKAMVSTMHIRDE